VKYSRIRWKYKVEQGFAYKLQCAYTIKQDYGTPYFTLTTTGWLLVHTLYAWDGATKFPDFDWIKTPSAIHDALHAAIAAGAIPESENDLIDKELELAIAGNPGKRWLLKARGWYVRKATNAVDEKAGAVAEIIELPRLQNEYTLAEYAAIQKG